MQAVILAAGKSTRTHPLTLTRPKALLPIAGRPLLSHQLEALHGIAKEVFIVVGYKGEMIKKKYSHRYGNIRLTFVQQEEQLGTGHALMQVQRFLKKRFIVLYGDDLYSREDLKQVAKTKWGVLVKEVEDPSRFGIVITENDKAVEIVEKPTQDVGNLANAGAFVFTPEIFQSEIGKSMRGEFEITDMFNAIAKKQIITPVTVKKGWIPIGYPWDVLNANEFLLNEMKGQTIKGSVEKGVVIKGSVKIGRGTLVKAGTYIEGPVVIGEDCIIGPGAYLRPHTSMGDKCKIGRAEIVDSVLMDEVNAKHTCYIGHSVVGEGSNIAAGTVTADYRHDRTNNVTLVNGKKVDSGRRKLGSFMGDHVHTGINCCIYPGRMIWPGKSVLPGEIVTKNVEE
ncbi:NTP transferase domain-containing protein [Candidatus Woesearchaeota archaeon]|nr:NTP transferase domain-containing protein [Candidatus Woesearchaeota archaeon]